MIPKRQKLTRTTFPKHTDPRKTWTGSFLRVQVTFTRSTDNPLFAVVILKKIEASAVKRNQLRRMIYELIEIEKDTFSKKVGVKYVFFPLKKNGVVDTASIAKDIHDFCVQI